MRRNTGSIAANPILIGAATTLITVVAVFLAYNANSGLPFVPSYTLEAQMRNASGLIEGNEVRMGGARIGVVSEIKPLVRGNGGVGALLTLKLDREIGELPEDTTLKVRPRSPLGLKYVEVTRGRSRTTLPDQGTVPLQSKGAVPVEFDEFFGTWDEPTRAASQDSLGEFGNVFAGRGKDLNAALGKLNPLLDHAEPALRNLNDRRTKFDELFPAFEQTASEVRPVAQTQGPMFEHLNTTFRALSDVAPDLKATIAGGPRALDIATRELPAQASFVRESTELFARLRPGFRSLAQSSPATARAFRAGEPALRKSPQLNARLVQTFQDLEDFAANPATRPGLQRLTRTAPLLQPTLAFATPAQTTCNYLSLFFSNLSSALSENDVIGTNLTAQAIFPPYGLPNAEASPASAPANGPDSDLNGKDDSFLHSNPYPNTAAPGQEPECEAGNEKYLQNRQVVGNEPGNRGTFSEKTWEGDK